MVALGGSGERKISSKKKKMGYIIKDHLKTVAKWTLSNIRCSGKCPDPL